MLCLLCPLYPLCLGGHRGSCAPQRCARKLGVVTEPQGANRVSGGDAVCICCSASAAHAMVGRLCSSPSPACRSVFSG